MNKKILPLLLLSILVATSATTRYIKAPAISSDGQGVITQLEVEIREGKGRVLVTAEPLVGVDTQHSERTAVAVAQEITGVNLTDKDVIFTFHADVNLVDGPSAGAAMAVATIAALTDQPINQDILITGTIESNGRVGHVGGILKKAKAVSDMGIRTFLIPKGQRSQTEYVKKVSTPSPGIYIETVEPITVDVSAFAEQWGLNVVEVSNITEALGYMLGNATIEPKKLEYKPLLDVVGATKMKNMADMEIKRAEDIGLNVSKSRELYRKGYYYSAANEAFQAVIKERSRGDLDEMRAQLRESLFKLKDKLQQFNTTEYHQSDIEWIAAAQQRYMQATNVVDSTSGADLAAAQEWVALSEFCLNQVENQGSTVSIDQIKLKLSNTIDAAARKAMVAQAIGETRAKNYLDLAIKSSDNGFYLGAVNFAADAISISDAYSGPDPYTQLDQELEKPVRGNWAVSYMDHAKYLRFVAQNKTRNDAIEALFYALRAQEYMDAYSFVTAPATEAPPAPAEQEATADDRVLWAIAGAYIISLAAIYFSRTRKPKINKLKLQEIEAKVRKI